MIKKENRILIIGSSNTDMTVRIAHLPVPGETVLGGSFTMGQGGKGANQAVAVSRLGGYAEFVCMVGNDMFGRNSIEYYQKEGISTDNCFISDSTSSGVALISVDESAENCIAVASGANADLSVSHMEQLRPLIESAELLLLQLEIPVETVVAAAKIAYDAGVKVVLNPAPACALPKELFQYVSLMIPNQTELAMLTGQEISDEASALKGIGILKDKGVETVIVTMGAQGALVSLPEKDSFVPSMKVKAVDTTAAGDTFCGGVCVALAEGRSIEEAVAFATAAASITVCNIGAQDSIPFREAVENKLKNN